MCAILTTRPAHDFLSLVLKGLPAPFLQARESELIFLSEEDPSERIFPSEESLYYCREPLLLKTDFASRKNISLSLFDNIAFF